MGSVQREVAELAYGLVADAGAVAGDEHLGAVAEQRALGHRGDGHLPDRGPAPQVVAELVPAAAERRARGRGQRGGRDQQPGPAPGRHQRGCDADHDDGRPHRPRPRRREADRRQGHRRRAGPAPRAAPRRGQRRDGTDQRHEARQEGGAAQSRAEPALELDQIGVGLEAGELQRPGRAHRRHRHNRGIHQRGGRRVRASPPQRQAHRERRREPGPGEEPLEPVGRPQQRPPDRVAGQGGRPHECAQHHRGRRPQPAGHDQRRAPGPPKHQQSRTQPDHRGLGRDEAIESLRIPDDGGHGHHQHETSRSRRGQAVAPAPRRASRGVVRAGPPRRPPRGVVRVRPAGSASQRCRPRPVFPPRPSGVGGFRHARQLRGRRPQRSITSYPLPGMPEAQGTPAGAASRSATSRKT